MRRTPVSALLWRWLPAWRLDPLLLGLLVLVMASGLAVLYSASEQDASMVGKQVIRLGLGVTLMVVISQVPSRLLRLWSPWLYVLGTCLLLAVWLFGVGRGAQRWLDLGVVRFQPSEIMKLAVPMAMAAWLHHRPQPPDLRGLLVAGVLLAVPMVLIARQPDLGTAVLVGAGGLAVLFLSGISFTLITTLAAAAAAAAPVAWMYVLHDYQKRRILTFLNPESDPLGHGWNVIQSKVAVGSGGLTGKGWLAGTQSHLEFLPEPHTDFILAVLAEEFGLLGVLAMLVLYAAIIWRATYMAMACRDVFSRLVSGSLVFLFFLYVLVNAGMAAGLLPVVGVPLPLVSYGGTSAATLLAGFGIIMGLYSRRRLMS